MPRLDLIIGMVSLTLCCYATMPSDKVGRRKNETHLCVNVAPIHGSECAKPPKIDNAILLGNWDEETYSQGHMANYSCHPGYVLSMRIKMACVDGKWETLSNGQCRKKSCGHPGDTPFGSFDLKEGYEFVFGAVVEYTCDDGYQMVSKHKIRICAADGWTNETPHCEARLCPPVRDDSIRVLSYVTDDEYSMGHVITLQCKNPNDKLKGPSQIHCTANGTWNMDPPTCKASCTIQENDMRINNIQLKNNQVLHYEDNEDVQFECVSGYKISDPANLRIQCNSSLLKYPTCHKIPNLPQESLDQYHLNAKKHLSVSPHCGKPPQIPHGEIITSMRDVYRSGSSVKYNCPHLFKLRGRKLINCQSGIWEDPPICLEPCTTSDKNMTENHIMLSWKQNHKKLCIRDDQKKNQAKKCYIKHDERIRFACLPEYKISDPKDLISKCNRGILPYPRCFQRK